MDDDIVERPARLPLYADGYYARRIAAGERPIFGYPASPPREPAIIAMFVRSGYAEALKKCI